MDNPTEDMVLYGIRELWQNSLTMMAKSKSLNRMALYLYGRNLLKGAKEF